MAPFGTKGGPVGGCDDYFSNDFSLLTFNMRGLFTGEAKGKLDYLVTALSAGDGPCFACLQEVGVAGDEPPPVLVDALRQLSARIYIHGVSEGDDPGSTGVLSWGSRPGL